MDCSEHATLVTARSGYAASKGSCASAASFVSGVSAAGPKCFLLGSLLKMRNGSWAPVHGASKTATKIVIPAAPKVSTWSRAIGSHSFADGLLVEKVLDPNDDLRKNLFDGRYAAASIAGSTYPTLVARKRLMWEKDCDIAVSIGLTAMRTIHRFSSPGSAVFCTIALGI